MATAGPSNFGRPLALVTGASSGIGLSLAKEFARGGFDLLITAQHDGIHRVAPQLQALGASVQVFQADLATREGVDSLWRFVELQARPLDAAALNAGVGVGGASFADTDLEEELRLIQLNVTASVILAKRLVTSMKRFGKGRILFTSSIASEMRSPFEAVYGASKSFLQSFSHSLRDELKDTGITVTALLPGPTETNFFHRAHMDDTRVGADKKDDPDQVAHQGFEALMAGRSQVQAGSLKTRLMGTAARVLPEVVKSAMHRRMSEPGGARKH